MPPRLQKGDTNPEVLKVQNILTEQGFYNEIVLPFRFDAKLEDAVIYFQQTHLGPDGVPLVVDGVVGPDTWWALKHPSGKKQKSFLEPKVPKGITGERHAVLLKAVDEHSKGVKEVPNGSNRSSEIDKYLPGWWLNKHGPGEKGPPWCCFFVHWDFHEATGRYPCGARIGSCSKLAQKAQELDMWKPYQSRLSPLYICPGDIFVILHPRKPGKPQTGHTGLVLRVNKDYTKINTVEGNCGNRVKVGLRDVSSITGFINPYYDRGQPMEFSHTLLKAPKVAAATTR